MLVDITPLLSHSKKTPLPQILMLILFYQRSHCLITVRRDKWLSVVPISTAYQSTCKPLGFLSTTSTCGSSQFFLPCPTLNASSSQTSLLQRLIPIHYVSYTPSFLVFSSCSPLSCPSPLVISLLFSHSPHLSIPYE